MEESSYLPIYSRRPGGARQPWRRETSISQHRSSTSPVQKCVHVIPVIVFFTFFILWWFSYPVNLVIKGGTIVEIFPTEMANQMIPTLNDTHVELAILASALSPSNIGVTPLNLTGKNETESVLLMSKSD